MSAINIIQATPPRQPTASQPVDTTGLAGTAPSPDVSEQPGTPAPVTPDSASMQDLVDQMQEAIGTAAGYHYQVAFRPDSPSQGYVIEIRDLEGAVVRQFPPEKILNLWDKLADLSGMVVDETT